MPRRSDGTLNRDLVRVACALSNKDFKDPDPHWGSEFIRAGYTQIPRIREGNPHKTNTEIGLPGQIQARNDSATYVRFDEREEEEADWDLYILRSRHGRADMECNASSLAVEVRYIFHCFQLLRNKEILGFIVRATSKVISRPLLRNVVITMICRDYAYM